MGWKAAISDIGWAMASAPQHSWKCIACMSNNYLEITIHDKKKHSNKQQSPASPQTSPPHAETIGAVKATTRVEQAVTREGMRPRDVVLTQTSALTVATSSWIFFPLAAGSSTNCSSPVTNPTPILGVIGFGVVPPQEPLGCVHSRWRVSQPPQRNILTNLNNFSG